MKPSTKSSYEKMFLIDEQMYNKILPLLNEIDRQELVSLNNDHKSDDQKTIENRENDNPSIEESSLPSHIQPAKSIENLGNSTLKIDQPVSVNPETSLKPRKTMRPKKFECTKCEKGFTTKFSLKRHANKFHPSPSEPNIRESEPEQKGEKEIEIIQKPVRISKYSNRPLKRKNQQTHENEEIDDTYQKIPRIRGIKRTKDLSSDVTDATDNKQMRYQSGMTEADYYAPKGVKRRIARVIDSKPNKKIRWVNF